MTQDPKRTNHGVKTMNRNTNSKSSSKKARSYLWIFEIAIIATIVPALVAGVSALDRLPIV
jgi:hypothetical protein